MSPPIERAECSPRTGGERKPRESEQLFLALLRGEASSAEYVAALRAEARQSTAQLLERARERKRHG